MIPIGATVRWRPKFDKRATVIGKVTAHRPAIGRGQMIEIDHRGWWVSEGLLEVVGAMHTDYSDANARHAELTAIVAERDALRELVADQATTNAELAQELQAGSDEALQAKIEELQEWVRNVQSYTEDLLLLFMGERRPVRRIEPDELRRLAEFVFEGV